FGRAIRRREPKVSFASDERSALPDWAPGKRFGYEVSSDERDVRRFQGQRGLDRLRWVLENRPDGCVLSKNQREAGRGAIAGRIVGRYAEIVAWTADRIEDRLRGVQEAETVRPAVVIRAPIRILRCERQSIRRVVGRSCSALVFTILGDEQAAVQWMAFRREASGGGGPGCPGER